jgi:Uma2 family endonuclease
MPEIVVEVLSGSNTRAGMEEKRRLYFEAGAREVWMCDPEGRLDFYSAAGELPASELMPSFPTVVA